MRFHSKSLVVAGLLLALLGCESDPVESPEDVFRTFLTHYFRGDAESAFQLVAPADRDALTAPLKAANAEIRPWQMLVVAEVENLYDIAKIEPSQKFAGVVADGTRTTLTVHRSDGTLIEVEMLHQSGRWYIDLPLVDDAGAAG